MSFFLSLKQLHLKIILLIVFTTTIPGILQQPPTEKTANPCCSQMFSNTLLLQSFFMRLDILFPVHIIIWAPIRTELRVKRCRNGRSFLLLKVHHTSPFMDRWREYSSAYKQAVELLQNVLFVFVIDDILQQSFASLVCMFSQSLSDLFLKVLLPLG